MVRNGLALQGLVVYEHWCILKHRVLTVLYGYLLYSVELMALGLESLALVHKRGLQPEDLNSR